LHQLTCIGKSLIYIVQSLIQYWKQVNRYCMQCMTQMTADLVMKLVARQTPSFSGGSDGIFQAV